MRGLFWLLNGRARQDVGATPRIIEEHLPRFFNESMIRSARPV
jgi:hypothetical protein